MNKLTTGSIIGKFEKKNIGEMINFLSHDRTFCVYDL